MAKPTHLETSSASTAGIWRAGLVKWGSIASVGGILFVGVMLMVTSFLSSAGLFLTIVEFFFGAADFLAGTLLLRETLRKKQAAIVVSMWPGEIALAATFMYLGTAMSIFHQGLASFQIALFQFVVILLDFVLGTFALILSGMTKGIRQASRFTPVACLRDGVILILGTILLAISLTQLAGPTMKPPLWDWTSYLFITLPGMLILIAREGVKQVTERWTGLKRFFRLMLTEFMLIGGLMILLYGSYANLNLGTNGYVYLSHIKGNGYGFTLWGTAVLFLILVRGPFKLTIPPEKRRFGLQVVSQMFYVMALIAFVCGERSLINGVAPRIVVGGAAPVVLIFLVSGILLIVPGRVLGVGRVAQ